MVRVMLTCAGCALLPGCMPKSFPRSVTAPEQALTAVALGADRVGAEIIPRYEVGRRYSLQRQTPKVEYSFYTDVRFKTDPTLFYPAPEGAPEVEKVKTLQNTRDTEVTLIKWESQYWPQNPDFALRYETYQEAHTAYAVYLRSKRPINRGAVIVSHAWTGGDIFRKRHYDEKKMYQYLDLGYDAVVIQEPYHGMRSLENTIFSGEQFLSGDISVIAEALCQEVTDIRGIRTWLQDRYDVVGLMGENMGATAALMAAVADPGFAFVVAWEPIASPGELPNDSPVAPFAFKAMYASGLDQNLIKKVLYVASPVNYDLAIPQKDVLMFAGMGDGFVIPDQPGMLKKKWDDAGLFWFAGGHLVNFQKKICYQKERAFMRSHLPHKKDAAVKAGDKKPEQEKSGKTKWWKRKKPGG
ncbi:MAG TPA: hypothetical protein VM658_18305 [bacterium]|nr:hypothetical protein [bacterium]